jgi:hypothetical protein
MHRLVALLLVVCLTTQEVASLKAPIKVRPKSVNEARVGTAGVVIGQGKKQQQHARANLAYNDPGPRQQGVFRDWRADEAHNTAADSRLEPAASQLPGYDHQEAEESRYRKYEEAEQERRHRRQQRQQEELKAADYIPYYATPDEPAYQKPYQNSAQHQQHYQQDKEQQHQEETATTHVPPPQQPPPQPKERPAEHCKANTHCPTAQLADDVKQGEPWFACCSV